MDQLIKRGFVDDLARCNRDIAANLKRLWVCMGELPTLNINEHMLKPFEQILPAAFHRFLQDHRIGHRKVGRAHRLNHRPRGKSDFFFLRSVNALHAVSGFKHMV